MKMYLRIIVLTIFGVGIVAAMYYNSVDKSDVSVVEQEGMGPVGAGSFVPVDFTNARKLVGYSHYVFAGKVINQSGNILPFGMPHTLYEVEIIYNIKGDTPGTITLDLDATRGSSLLEGATYLFTALHFEGVDQNYHVGPDNAMKTLVTDDRGLTNEQLRDAVLKHERTYELLNAYPNEILYGRGEQHENAFKFLEDAEKLAVYAKFQELIPPRSVPELLPPPPSPVPPPPKENDWLYCLDGADNDGDGLIDKADPDCASVLRENVRGLCEDEFDDDLDGLIDAADPDCAQFYPAQ